MQVYKIRSLFYESASHVLEITLRLSSACRADDTNIARETHT